jgi:hypothetical protein
MFVTSNHPICCLECFEDGDSRFFLREGVEVSRDLLLFGVGAVFESFLEL